MAKATLYTDEVIKKYTSQGIWSAETLSDLYENNARNYPDREALVDHSRRLTWSQANRWIDRLALGFLDLGLKKDEMVVVQLPNMVEVPLLRVACEKAGLLCLQALRNYRHAEMGHILKYLDAAAVVIPWEYRGFDHFQMVQELRPGLSRLRHILVPGGSIPPGAISLKNMIERPIEKEFPPDTLRKTRTPSTEFSLVVHTTGTTGMPKFVEYPACTRIYQWGKNAEVIKLNKDDIFAVVGPAPGGPNFPAYTGGPLKAAKIVMLERFDAEEALKLIEKEKCTIVSVVPAQLAMMVRHPNRDKYSYKSVRIWWCTSSVLDPNIGREAEEKMGGKVIIVLGATDWGGEVLTSPDLPREQRLGTVGRPVDGTEIRLVDDDGRDAPPGSVGEIWSRSPSAISGYYKDIEATNQAWAGGWYRLGDLGKFDEHGNLMVVGRKKDMIIRGGQNIYPIEIESILLTHPKVADVAVVAMPDAIMGEKACAFVVPKKGQTLTFDQMTGFLKEKNLAAFKLPERLELIEAMPMAGEQKVDKKLLRQQIADKLQAERKP
ncbi:MAG: AMP-binding protein [Chloroflexi bacterium]|nr:AMP-binding protein [Chloroflexota bacterium]